MEVSKVMGPMGIPKSSCPETIYFIDRTIVSTGVPQPMTGETLIWFINPVNYAQLISLIIVIYISHKP